MDKFQKIVSLIKDIGIILGFPIIIGIGISLYNVQIDALKEQNELLKQTQYDKSLALIKAQKEIVNYERSVLIDSVRIINGIMIDIEKFNNMQSFPDDKINEEYISEFEQNIETVAEKLRLLEPLVKNGK